MELKSLNEFLTQEISPKEMAAVLIQVMEEYVNYVLRDKDRFGNDDTGNNVYLMRQLILSLKGE